MEIEHEDRVHLKMSLDDLLEIMGNPTRRVILAKLAKLPHSTSELHKALGISRQAVHSQLEILKKYNLIEKIDPEKRGGKYRIVANLSLTMDISPDYYNIEYNTTNIKADSEAMFLKDAIDSTVYKNIKRPDEKVKFLGERIKNIEENICELERKRRELLQRKEGVIIALKKLVAKKYKHKLKQEKTRLDNLEKEILYTLFFQPAKFTQKINIDHLLDELFFSDIDRISRASHRTSIEELLRDISKAMGFIHNLDDDWIFDI
ncbi:MAG: Helix-turn-helix domain protein [Promethearchaeota archaeon]|nr:MAG: Helix-turn-helix domain protein [Candidatus Lokiarchaeota archaeon]